MREYPLSPAQRQCLAASHQLFDAAFHTTQVSISLGERVDLDAIRRAWKVVVDLHPALRTVLKKEGDDLLCVEQSEVEPAWQELDWQENAPEDLGAAWKEIVDWDANAPIAVHSEAGTRVHMIRLPNGEGHALWSYHALLLDEDSAFRVLRSWLAAYDEIRTGGSAEWTPTPSPADAFEKLSGKNPAAEKAWWREHFDGFEPARPLLLLPLPSAVAETRRTVSHTFEREDHKTIKALTAAANGSFGALAKAAWALVVSRAALAGEALLLEPGSLRPPDTEVVGRFEGWIPRRTQVPAKGTLASWMAGIESAAALPPAPCTFGIEQIASEIEKEPGDITPETAFVFRRLSLSDRLQMEAPRWMGADVRLFARSAPSIALLVTASDRPEAELDYDPSVLSDGAALNLLKRWVHLIDAFMADPKAKLADISLLLPEESATIEGAECPVTVRSLVPQCLHEIFDDIAREIPDRIAIDAGTEKLSYSRLAQQSNHLAKALCKRGVEPGQQVALIAGRSPKWIVSVLGILKSGATAVLLDPAIEEKKAAGHKIAAVVVGESTAKPAFLEKLPAIHLDSEWSGIMDDRSKNPKISIEPAAAACSWIDAKSGAGLVAASHLELGVAAQSLLAILDLEQDDRVLQIALPASPAAIEGVLAALFAGATIVHRAEDAWSTRTAFQEFISESAVTALSLPTPFWSQWIQYLAELSLAVPASLRVAAIRGHRILPAATTAWQRVAGDSQLVFRHSHPSRPGLALAWKLPKDFAPGKSALPLGRPVPGASARLIDSFSRPVPAGFTGKLEIAYHASGKDGSPVGSPSAGPFQSLDIDALADPDGNFHGRQVLEAFQAPSVRFTPAEAIEVVAASHPEIFDCVVLFRKFDAKSEPCLWIVPVDTQRGEPIDFRDFLAGHLPAEIVPERIACLQRFPLTTAGEIDFAALPETDREAPPSPEAANGGSKEEEALRRIVSRALGGRSIKLDQTIHEASRKAHVAELLQEVVSKNGYDSTLTDFQTPFSIRSLLRSIRSRRSLSPGGQWVPLKPLRVSGARPPIILVHDINGSAKDFGALAAALGDDQPCYALTARGLQNPSACHASIPEMAADYLEAIRVFDPEGPISLIGVGFGGLVAFEMARQLESNGGAARFLAIFATEPPGNESASGKLRLLSSGLRKSLREFPSLFGKRADADAGCRKDQESPVYRANAEAAGKYVASPIRSIAHIFVPEASFLPFRDIRSGWLPLCREAEFYQVPCTPAEMLEEPAAGAVGEVLARLAAPEKPGKPLAQ